ncbi:MAG: hypothetical protein WCR91_08680 [Sphaerochaetaceae bacterium]|jgi:hypothetical protein|nr:hypothetical protein [Sphaerochaetaceae bacterium]
MKKGYILRRTKGQSIYLSPFQNTATSATWSTEEEIVWHASTVLNTKEKDDILFTLYKHIDRGVDRWIQDARYLPRLLLCALAFLVTYFFFSLAVRDPIPMVDELLIAGFVAFLLGMFLSSRDKKSDLAMKKRLEIKQNASRADFVVLEGLESYEKYLDDMAFIDTIELADRLVLSGNGELAELIVKDEHTLSHQDEIARLLFEFIRINDKRLYYWYEKVLQVRLTQKRDISLSARLLKLSIDQHLDLPVLALMIAISKQ